MLNSLSGLSPEATAGESDLPFLNSSLFREWRDPASGVRSFILTRRVAPIQQSFYYVTQSATSDGKYFWFYCGFPPSGDARSGRVLGLLDFEAGNVRFLPETQFTEASPLVDLRDGRAFWCSGAQIWSIGPELGDVPRLVNEFPEEITNHRRVARVATHLTFSADFRCVNFDAEIGEEWCVGGAPLDGGDVEVWQKFDRCYDHGQFSPTDPALQLISQDYHCHPLTGIVRGYENRLWTIRRGEQAVPVYPHNENPDYKGTAFNAHMSHAGPQAVHDPRRLHGHEWWSADGKGIWYVHYGHGVEYRCLQTQKTSLVWPLKTVSHAHASMDGKYLVGDNQPPSNPSDSRVVFYNRTTQTDIEIVAHIPHASRAIKRYHVDPHPQFCFNDRVIAYTTTVLGGVDVAFTVVDELVSRTQ